MQSSYEHRQTSYASLIRAKGCFQTLLPVDSGIMIFVCAHQSSALLENNLDDVRDVIALKVLSMCKGASGADGVGGENSAANSELSILKFSF